MAKIKFGLETNAFVSMDIMRLLDSAFNVEMENFMINLDKSVELLALLMNSGMLI